MPAAAFCSSTLSLCRRALLRSGVSSCSFRVSLPGSLPSQPVSFVSFRQTIHGRNQRNFVSLGRKHSRRVTATASAGTNRTQMPPNTTAPLGAENVHSYSSVDELLGAFDTLGDEERLGKPVAEIIRYVFPFEIDEFQNDALLALSSGQSVVLSAPTGAGKTIVGEMAVYLGLCRQMRVFYTTPLKALSNQKFYDFKKQFGEERVGLLTGDVTINRDADIVVMTTEIYRNMLYADSVENNDLTAVTDDLFAVVFDEFHYLNDRDRGTVWEESVINSPSHVLLVALSATMSNTGDVRDWFGSVQGPTALVQSDIRPVPLTFGYCDREGVTPLFEKPREKSQTKKKKKGFGRRQKAEAEADVLKLHPKLLRKIKESKDARNSRDRRGRLDDDDIRGINRDRFRRIASRERQRSEMKEIPSYPFVVRSLRRRDMLPCIVFIFSRAGCDKAAMATAREKESLVTPTEQEQIRQKIDAFSREHPGMVQQDRIDLALQGIASHHAGLLPLWKVCVEELFQEGLIKVVFATETLAAGINMPARTTVISSLSKRAGEEGIVQLSTSEVLQMAGRAGRRGKDVIGHSVVLKSRSEGPMQAFKVLTAGVDALESKFTPSYGMVLNLLSIRPLSEAKKLVDRSFGNFLRHKRLSERESKAASASEENFDDDIEVIIREKDALESVLQDAKRFLESSDEKSVRSYIKNLERVKAEKRALVYLEQQSFTMEADLVEETLTFAPTGTKILLRNKKIQAKAGSREERKRRQDYSAAINAAGEGDMGAELRSFYLEAPNPDLEMIEEEDENKPELIEAVLLDIHYDSMGILPTFCAVDADGVLRMFNHTGVARILFEEDSVDVDALVGGWDVESLPPRGDWESIGDEQYAAALPEKLNPVLPLVQEWRQQRAESVQKNQQENTPNVLLENKPEIAAQRERLRYAKQQVRNHELHGKEETRVLLAAKRAVPRIEAILDGRADPFGKKRRQGKNVRYNRYARLKESTKDQGSTNSAINSSWDDFMNLVSVLQHYGFLDESYNVTSLGSLGAKVRSENELWTSLVLMDPDMDSISPVSLAAVLGATQMDSSRSDAYVATEVCQEVRDTVGNISVERVRLHSVQNEFNVELGTALDADLMGLVEMWASGMSWVELLSNTSLQEGDACRVLRRVLDVLRQIQHLPVVSRELKKNARRAIALLDRFPVTDDRTYTVRPNEKAEEDEVASGVVDDQE